MKFYDREKELELLTRIKKDFRIAIVGRRRIGKTRLAEEAYPKERITLFMPAEKAEKEIINDWTEEYQEMRLPKVSTFKEFFEFLFFHYKNKIIFIDEIQNTLKVNKSFIFDLQRLIDKHKPKLIVSGSLINAMKKIVEGYKSPLYGRFDCIIKLKELNFKTIYLICKDLKLSTETAFAVYSIFGGIPKYYELIEKLEEFNFEQTIIQLFAEYPRPLYEEVKTMLKEEFGKEYKTFFSILAAICQGKNKHSEIADYIGRKPTEITKYLLMLRKDFELIEKKAPVVGGKKGIYAAKNNIITFWFNNIWKYSQFYETGQEEQASGYLKKNLNKHLALMFEKTIRELITTRTIKILTGQQKTGSQWGKFKGEKGKNTYEIDLVALNENTKEILFGECKWQEQINAKTIIKELAEKAKHVEWNNGTRKETYAIFAKSFSTKITEYKGKRICCFDLKDIEQSLEEH